MNVLALQTAAPQVFDLTTGSADLLGAWLICFFTLAVFSFLYGDNPFYKIAEHVFVGVGTAYYALKYYEEGVKGSIYEHIERALAADGLVQLGGYDVDPTVAIVLRSVALVLALLLVARLFVPNFWGSRWPLAIMVGIYAALKMTGETQSKLVLQIKGSMNSLTNPELAAWDSDWARIEDTQVFYTFANTLVLLATICALAHFVFTYRRARLLAGLSRAGIVVLMVTFGSMFGFTVLGRIALLLERVDQLAFYNEPEYALASSSLAVGDAVLLSPPILTAGALILMLTLGHMLRKGRGTPSGAA